MPRQWSARVRVERTIGEEPERLGRAEGEVFGWLNIFRQDEHDKQETQAMNTILCHWRCFAAFFLGVLLWAGCGDPLDHLCASDKANKGVFRVAYRESEGLLAHDWEYTVRIENLTYTPASQVRLTINDLWTGKLQNLWDFRTKPKKGATRDQIPAYGSVSVDFSSDCNNQLNCRDSATNTMPIGGRIDKITVRYDGGEETFTLR
jgi:hypothetical protein